MKTNAAIESLPLFPLPLTKHAETRMNERRISDETVHMVLTYGRLIRVRGAEIFVIGRKEIEFYITDGLDLSPYEGAQVVCSPDGSILTVYRNKDFRGLRSRSGHRYYRLAA